MVKRRGNATHYRCEQQCDGGNGEKWLMAVICVYLQSYICRCICMKDILDPCQQQLRISWNVVSGGRNNTAAISDTFTGEPNKVPCMRITLTPCVEGSRCPLSLRAQNLSRRVDGFEVQTSFLGYTWRGCQAARKDYGVVLCRSPVGCVAPERY
jgi:hypothetical protein